MTIWACRAGRSPLLKFERRQWVGLIEELCRRGAGRRESGAFLLARAACPRQVCHIEYFDNLDPSCLQGNIHFDGRAFSKLWDLCEARDLVVVADVHTHPGKSVRQSSIDRENPMIARAGHVALVVPRFATRTVRAREVGVHEYCGDDEWRSWFGRPATARLLIRRWL